MIVVLSFIQFMLPDFFWAYDAHYFFQASILILGHWHVSRVPKVLIVRPLSAAQISLFLRWPVTGVIFLQRSPHFIFARLEPTHVRVLWMEHAIRATMVSYVVSVSWGSIWQVTVALVRECITVEWYQPQTKNIVLSEDLPLYAVFWVSIQ